MATRGRIGIELSDGSILSSYHHWDSYPEWLGRMLKTHYNGKSLASELIDGGDMSSCWTDDRWDDTGVVGVYGPQYYSQRGEDCPPRHDKDHGEYLKMCGESDEEYSYLFTTQGEWICYDTCTWHDTYLESVDIPSGALAV
jgi:hypothetical protein